jgi:acyl-coenzyme A thioesterase PaaI-like protein
VDFRLCEDGYVEARLECPSVLQGYDGILHGGVTSSLLDGAMTNCLFAHGVVAVTAELRVRFRDPIPVQLPLLVRAAICDSKPPLYVLEAWIMQGGKVKAKAKGKFMARASGKPE